MSKVFNCSPTENCKPWQAPSFESSHDDGVDYELPPSSKLPESQDLRHIRQQAYEQSYAKGYLEGVEQGKQAMAVEVEHLRSIMATLSMPIEGFDDQLVHELMQVSMLVMKQLVRREIKSAPGEIIAVIKEALKLLPETSGEIRLELNPDDASLVREAFGDMDSETHWRLIEDPLMSRGGCRVITETSRIDATLENRLNKAVAALMGSERNVDENA